MTDQHPPGPNPVEGVPGARVALVVRGLVRDLVALSWLAEDEVPEGARRAIVVVSCHAEVLRVVYPPGDRNVVSFMARELLDQTPGARGFNVSSTLARRNLDRYRRPPIGTYLPFTNVGVRNATVFNERRGARKRSSHPLSDMRRGMLSAVGLGPLDTVGKAG